MARALCSDWACPSLWSCARAFGRSEAYWAFDVDDPTELYLGPRKEGFDACDDYERDKPRPWLADVFMAQIPMARPDIPAGFKLHVVKEHGT